MQTTATGILLTLADVQAETKLGHTSIYKLMGEGKFPRSVRVTGTRGVRWRRRDIEEWANRLPEAVPA